MEGDRFCTACGAKLPDDAVFCPECGQSIDGTVGQSTRSIGRSLSFSVLFIIYGVIAIISGLMCMISYAGMDYVTYQSLIDMMSEITGEDVSSLMPVWTDSLPTMIGLSSASLAISGILALFCYVLCKKADNWRAAVIVCLASSVICIGMACFSLFATFGIILCAIGLFFTVLIYLHKDSFAA